MLPCIFLNTELICSVFVVYHMWVYMIKVCCWSIIRSKICCSFSQLFSPTSVSVCWCYRFFNVQFSSDVANVRIGLTLISGLVMTWTLNFWPSNVIRSLLSPTASRLYWSNFHKQFVRYHVHRHTHRQPENRMPLAGNCRQCVRLNTVEVALFKEEEEMYKNCSLCIIVLMETDT